MNREERINILSRLGCILKSIGKQEKWSGFELGINEEEYNNIVQLTENVHIYNGWFTPESVRSSFLGIASWLTEQELTKFVSTYSFDSSSKRIAVIMAGNIPLVGFHDFLAIYLSGNKAIVKLSSDDKQLFPAIVKTLKLFDPEIEDKVEICTDSLSEFDAVIATGSDNSSRHFEYYFGNYPNIIRKNRNAIAFIDGSESKEELALLGNDIFQYYGLGCRNVSQIWVPEDFELDRFFEAIYDFNEIINHNKYANNYDYNKAVYLMNQEELLDNGFLLLKEEEAIQSPLGVLFYRRYSDPKEFEAFVNEHESEIQLIVGKNYVPFGSAQCPEVSDFADGVDTMKFLEELA